MLSLLLFPMAEKVMHEFGHLNEEHCGIKETHFCPLEHNCDVCDYVFSTCSTPPRSHQITLAPHEAPFALIAFTSNTATSPKYTFTLRGPPVC